MEDRSRGLMTSSRKGGASNEPSRMTRLPTLRGTGMALSARCLGSFHMRPSRSADPMNNPHNQLAGRKGPVVVATVSPSVCHVIRDDFSIAGKPPGRPRLSRSLFSRGDQNTGRLVISSFHSPSMGRREPPSDRHGPHGWRALFPSLENRPPSLCSLS